MFVCARYSSQYWAPGNEQYDGSTIDTIKGQKPFPSLYFHAVPTATGVAFQQIALEV